MIGCQEVLTRSSMVWIYYFQVILYLQQAVPFSPRILSCQKWVHYTYYDSMIWYLVYSLLACFLARLVHVQNTISQNVVTRKFLWKSHRFVSYSTYPCSDFFLKLLGVRITKTSPSSEEWMHQLSSHSPNEELSCLYFKFPFQVLFMYFF